MASKESRQSAIDPSLPYRQPGADPARTGFDADSRAAAAGMYSFGSDTMTQEDITGVAAFSIFTAALTTASDIGALTLSATAADYDWSGMSLKAVRSGSPNIGAMAGCNLITDRHGLSAWHAGPNVNDVLHFRSPDGTERTATVEAITRMGTSDVRLVRFASAPHASLARYPVLTTAADIIGDGCWIAKQDASVCYRIVSYVTSTTLGHSDGGWLRSPNGSGRAAAIPLTDGSFTIAGLAWTASTCSLIEPQISNINSAISAYSETVTELDAPDLVPPPEPEDPAYGDLLLLTKECVDIPIINLAITNLQCIG